MKANHIRKLAIVVSIIVHIFLLLSYDSLSNIHLFNSTETLKKFNEQEKRLVFELVETPKNASSKIPPKKANLLSDKNSIARDRYIKKDKQIGAPHAKGDLNIKNLLQYMPIDRNNQLALNDRKANDDNKNLNENEYLIKQPKFSRQILLRKNNHKQTFQNLKRPDYKSEKFNARKIGGLTFNTYEWNFAPYMLEMKHKIERNIFPPPAFTHMGLIDGETMLRFKVMPSGDVTDVQVLNYKGHKSLMETSVNAIKSAIPFKPLPADFPENYLEVTASFSYYIQKY